MGGRRLMAAVVALLAAPGSASALPATGERETVDVEFTTAEPGTPAGVRYRFEILAPDGGEPPALRRLVVAPPPGSVIDTSAPEACTASDQELRTRGDAACPRGSYLGDGSAELVITGFGRQRFTQSAFNVEGGQFQNVKQGNTVQAVVRGRFTEEGLDALIPTCITGGQPPSGCPSDQARLLSSEIVLPPYTREGRSYLTTPPDCPPSGRWRSTIVLTYADGKTSRVHPEQPCTAAGTGGDGGGGGATECRSRRRVVFRALARIRLRSVSAVLRGRRIRLDPRLPVVDLTGLPRGRYAVRINAVTASGKKLRFVRRYRTCG